MKTTTLSTILAILLPMLVNAQCMTLSFQVSDFNGSNISCFGANDGAAFVNAIGPNRNMTYDWSNGQTDAQAQNLSAGNYTVTVTDNSGCVAVGSVTIIEPAPMSFSIQSVSTSFGYNLKCNGDANGRLTALATGGTGKILYNWSNGNQTAFATNLSAGIYTINATDENGCLAATNVAITQPNPVSVSTMLIIQPSGAGATDAEAIANANGGCGSFTFEWSNGELSNELYNVGAGLYTVKAIDALGCSSSTALTIANPLSNTIVNGNQGGRSNTSRGSGSQVLRP
jgi:hypothetical protein